MKTVQRGDHQFFAAVLELRAAENDAGARRLVLCPRSDQRRLRKARARVLSQRARTLRGILWRLMRLHIEMARGGEAANLTSLGAALRDLKALDRR